MKDNQKQFNRKLKQLNWKYLKDLHDILGDYNGIDLFDKTLCGNIISQAFRKMFILINQGLPSLVNLVSGIKYEEGDDEDED